MSSFASLNLGRQAIFAAQKGLDVTGQNIANSATPGYSRQRVDQVAVGGPTVPAIWAKYDQAAGGVKVTGVSRMRDEFLEARARTAQQNLAELNERTSAMESIERTVGEPSDTGLKQRLSEFWASWSKAGSDLKNSGARDVIVERGKAVTDEINRQAATLETQWADTRTQLDANVTAINKAAEDVAKLNKAIRNNIINGLPANELADQRDQLVEKITTLTGGVAVRAEDGVVDVRLGDGADSYLVSGEQARSVGIINDAATYAKSLASDGTQNKLGIGFASKFDRSAIDPADNAITTSYGSTTANKSTVGAQLRTLNETLPTYLGQLDDVAATFAKTVNTQQAKGYPVVGADRESTGPALVTSGLGDPDATPATTVPRAATQLTFTGTAEQVALSGTPYSSGGMDNTNAKDMAAQTSKVGGADDKFRTLVVTLGVEASSVYRNQAAAENVAKTADDARDSVSGVSLNEEMTNLIQYQHSFEAAAKFITAVDATIESLLNMTR